MVLWQLMLTSGPSKNLIPASLGNWCEPRSFHGHRLTNRIQDGPYRTTIMEPLGKMNAYFPIINEHIAKRSKKMLDYDSARSKQRKLIEKPSEDTTKLPKVRLGCLTLSPLTNVDPLIRHSKNTTMRKRSSTS
jgi:hypothetical protein